MKQTKPTILYLPGLDGEGYCAQKLAPHVADAAVEVFAYPTGTSLEWDTLCRLVVARMQRLGTRLLAGESFGGAVAQQVLFAHPEAPVAVMLISTFTQETEPGAAAIGRHASRLLPRKLLRPVARRLADWKLAGTLRGDERREFLARFTELDHKEMGRRLELLRGFDTRGKLAQVKIPIEVVFGTRDPLAGGSAQRKVWEAVPGCVLHPVEGHGHLVAAEAAEQVGAILNAWARRYS